MEISQGFREISKKWVAVYKKSARAREAGMEGPIYREAYPRLDVFQARLSNRMNEIDFNRWLCRFRIGETGFAGELVILERTDSSVIIDYFMRGAEHRYGGGQVHLCMADAPNGIDPARQLFRCDGCQRARASIQADCTAQQLDKAGNRESGRR